LGGANFSLNGMILLPFRATGLKNFPRFPNFRETLFEVCLFPNYLGTFAIALKFKSVPFLKLPFDMFCKGPLGMGIS